MFLNYPSTLLQKSWHAHKRENRIRCHLILGLKRSFMEFMNGDVWGQLCIVVMSLWVEGWLWANAWHLFFLWKTVEHCANSAVCCHCSCSDPLYQL